MRRRIILCFVFVLMLAGIFSFDKARSNASSPPPEYAGNPPVHLDCTGCHNGSAINDSLNFLLSIGTDTSNLAVLTSGVTHYVPGQTYFMRVHATQSSAKYGFEITANDASGSGTTIGSFAALNTNNTSYSNAFIGYFIGHKNANTNNEWTFQWTAPATNIGPITFYWAGNDANGDGTSGGDHIYLAQKTISVGTASGVTNYTEEANNIRLFPTVCSGNLQLEFNLIKDARVQAEVITMNGAIAAQALDETIAGAGTYQRTLDVKSLAPGIYLLRVQTGDGSAAVRKFIKL